MPPSTIVIVTARDEADEQLAQVRVAPGCKLNRASDTAWAERNYQRPG